MNAEEYRNIILESETKDRKKIDDLLDKDKSEQALDKLRFTAKFLSQIIDNIHLVEPNGVDKEYVVEARKYIAQSAHRLRNHILTKLKEIEQ